MKKTDSHELIRVESVSKYYGARCALHPTTLSLKEGQTHVFWGSSGSGKTTLLRLLAGLVDATEGRIFLEEKLVSTEIQAFLASRIGYVIQEGGLFPHLTARENLILAALPQNWSRQRIESRIRELMDLVHMESSILHRYPRELSGGQRQRVALMRSLFLDPSIILLDEPLGALDPLVRSDLQRELKQIFNSLKKTVIIVTHDIGEGAFFGHTISLFHEGHLIQHGDFKSFLDQPKSEFVTRFIHAQAPPKELLEAFR